MILRFFRKMIKWLIAAAILYGVFYFFVLPYCLPRKYNEIVEKYTSVFHLDESLVYAVIFCESGFDPDAVSSAGAVGLMQVTEDTALWAVGKIAWLDEETFDLTNPEDNIAVGCWYLDWLNGSFDNQYTALAAYNAGHGKVSEWLSENEHSSDGIHLENIPYAETDKYVKKVYIVRTLYRLFYGMQ